MIELILSEGYVAFIVGLDAGLALGVAAGVVIARREARDGEFPHLYAPKLSQKKGRRR